MNMIWMWIQDNWTFPNIMYAIGLLDILAGGLPNSWCRWPGIVLSLAKKAKDFDTKNGNKFKHLMVCFIAISFMISGCATMQGGDGPQIQISKEDRIVIASVAARHMGVAFAEQYPEHVEDMLCICVAILETDTDPEGLIEDAIDELCKQLDDPILAMDIKDLLSMVQFVDVVDPEYLAIYTEHIMECKTYVYAFAEGMLLVETYDGEIQKI